ncbi:MAG: GNAT family N-acetyltransferase [SAR202 cluster bacterium]|nr:GNAT family N-acetyltransferase [SAR202 cluster bacterium]
MKLRKATIGDLDTLTHLEDVVFDQYRYTRSQLKHLLTRAKATTYVMEDGGEIAGWAIMLWKKSVKVGRLYSLGVRADYRRRGIANELLGRLEKDAKARGCDRVSLETQASNADGRPFYSKRGYTVVETMQGYFVDGADAVRMMKWL